MNFKCLKEYRLIIINFYSQDRTNKSLCILIGLKLNSPKLVLCYKSMTLTNQKFKIQLLFFKIQDTLMLTILPLLKMIKMRVIFLILQEINSEILLNNNMMDKIYFLMY